MSNSPAGWYQDPQDQTQQRYWDGSQWTDHLAARPGQSIQAPPPSTLSADGVTSAQSSSATTSLVLGVLSLLCLGALAGIPAMLVGRKATREIDQSGGRIGGRGLATAGFVTGLIGTVLTTIPVIVVLIVFVFGNSMQSTFEETCTTINGDPSSTDCR